MAAHYRILHAIKMRQITYTLNRMATKSTQGNTLSVNITDIDVEEYIGDLEVGELRSDGNIGPMQK